ncbi:hypothetical protein HMPREF9074_08868 [Capnocytophaga sp. oral taxon 329 str. F0087]|nr:hypothetical protein HMPREF9074_08868 [Capnocytophaga sp. oral taxon 329 str. F0087]
MPKKFHLFRLRSFYKSRRFILFLEEVAYGKGKHFFASTPFAL